MTVRPVGGAIAKCADISKSAAADWMRIRSVGGAIAKYADVTSFPPYMGIVCYATLLL